MPLGVPRQITHAPVTLARDGALPGFVVACLDCSMAMDVCALTGNDAVESIAPAHQRGHRLIARPVVYDTHPLYRSALSHRRSILRSLSRRASDFINAACGIVSKYLRRN